MSRRVLILIGLLLCGEGIANANIQEMRIDRNGIYIREPYGREIIITKETIRAGFLQNGRDSTRTLLKQQIESAIGSEILSADSIDFEFADDGTPTELTIHHGIRMEVAIEAR